MNPAAERERSYTNIISAFIVQDTMPEWAGVVTREICIKWDTCYDLNM